MSRIAVAGPSRIVTDTAIEVAKEGGSVVDVAIVAMLTAMCTEPGVCGPGGGGFMTITLPGHAPVVIDCQVAIPGKGFSGERRVREVNMVYGGGTRTLVDAGSIAVPGSFAGLAMASEMLGEAPWRFLMETAADAVAGGFPLSYACHLYLSEGATQIFEVDPVTRTALMDDGLPKPEGSTITFPGLAETLREIGGSGVSTFYEGDIALMIVADLEKRGGLITREDMSSYRARATEPLQVSVAEMTLSIPATVGGHALRVALAQGEDFGSKGLARGLIAAFEDRYAAMRSPSTVSIAAADSDGGAIAASFSAGYVSGVVPEGTGLLMNNALGEIELLPEDAERIVPGERMISNMAPCVLSGDATSIAIGSPGADRITSALAFTIGRLALGDDLAAAIDHPRAHPEFDDEGVRVAVEPGIDTEGLGHPVRQFDQPHMYFGGVNGAGVLAGDLQAHADRRRTGSVTFNS